MARPRRNNGLGVLLLGSQLFSVGLNNIPPVTLCAIAAQVVIFLRLVALPWNPNHVCISSQHVWHHRQWQRLLFGALEHADDMHLYYNMASLLWKGRTLERKYGSRKFAVLLAAFTFLTGAVYVALNELAAEVFDDGHYVVQCAVGFSGVLFALKVLATHHSRDDGSRSASVFGIPLPIKWAYWAELLVIQLLVPNASFVGHLAGILVGLAYTSGPLKAILKPIYKTLRSGGIPQPSYRYAYGTSSQSTHSSSYYSSSQRNLNEEELRRMRNQYYSR